MNISEIYLQPERYNPRIRATVPGAWIAVRSDGNEFAVCPDYAASSADDVFEIILNREEMRGN